MVFASIAGSVATMESKERAGKIMGTTIATFVITGAIAAVIMFVLMKLFPPVLDPLEQISPLRRSANTPFHAGTDRQLLHRLPTLSVLLSRSAMLPLIVFSILFGFGVQLGPGRTASIVPSGSPACLTAMMKVVQIVTYYAPIAFFGFFADLVATYGSEIAADYGRAMAVYYPLCFIYIFTAFPLFAWFGGGKGAVGEHVPPHCPSRHHVSGHLLLCGYHPHQHGGGRPRPASPRTSAEHRAASGRHHAHGRLLLLLRAEDRFPASVCSVSRFNCVGDCSSSCWWPCCPPWA